MIGPEKDDDSCIEDGSWTHLDYGDSIDQPDTGVHSD